MTILSNGKRWPRYFHFWVSILLALAVVPLLRALNLPVRFDWLGLGSAYWLVLTAQSIFVAALLYLIGVVRLRPLLERIQRDKLRIVLGLAFFLILFWAFTWLKAIILTVDAIAVLEFRERSTPAFRREATRSVLIPAIYLFAGFLLIFAYNDIILSVRFYGATDAAFDAMESGCFAERPCATFATGPYDLCPFRSSIFLSSFTLECSPKSGPP